MGTQRTRNRQNNGHPKPNGEPRGRERQRGEGENLIRSEMQGEREANRMKIEV